MSRLKLFLYSHSRQQARKRLLIALLLVMGSFVILLPFKQEVKEISIFSIPERVTPNHLRKSGFAFYNASIHNRRKQTSFDTYAGDLYIDSYAITLHYPRNDSSRIIAQTIVMDNLAFRIMTKLPLKKYESVNIDGVRYKVLVRGRNVVLHRLNLNYSGDDIIYSIPNLSHIDRKEHSY